MGGHSSQKYPVVPAKDLGLDDYFKANPNVAGMAWGGGVNNSDPKQPRVVVINDYSPNLKTQEAKQSLIQNERIRHKMDEDKWKATFEITPEQTEWAKSLGAYANNSDLLKQTITARIATGDYVPSPTAEQIKSAKQFQK
jgi:hypothetical protein